MRPSRVHYQVTVRYGEERQRYHLFSVSAPGLSEALRQAADILPEEVERTGDLVEVRPSHDPEAREYMGEEGVGGAGEDAHRKPGRDAGEGPGVPGAEPPAEENASG